jgi:hypothetical protein
MNVKKKVRPYILKAYLKKNLQTITIIPMVSILFFGLYTFIIDGFASEDGFTREILNETILNVTAVTGGMCFVALSILSVIFKANAYEPIGFEATRKEAHVSYEILSVISYFIYIMFFSIMAVVSKVVSGKTLYYDKIFDVVIIYLSLFAMLKFLYSIYMENTFRKKCVCVIMMILTIILLGITCIIIIHSDSLVLFENHIWVYLLIALVAIAIWFASVRILSKKREVICLSDCRI